MTYEEAIKEAEIQFGVYESMILYNKDFEPKNDNSNYERKIEFLKIAIEALEKQATSEAASEWIPVSERLPEELVAVNVTWINRCPENYYTHIKDKPFTDTAVLYQGEWYWWDSTIIDYLSECGTCISGLVNKSIDILAWRPLPEPYKENK